MSQEFRLPIGGTVDRTKVMRFSFDGRVYEGYGGDTLASALLANGVRLVGRSFKYHRPRGIVGIGQEEPNALVNIHAGGASEPNTRATAVLLTDGLIAEPQNCWPSLRWDFGAVNDRVSALLPAGFYYKTFMWPRRGWRTYERFVRLAAGLGPPPKAPGGELYEKRYSHADVLVVGGGPSGLAAALAAARTGVRVLLADDGPDFGGRLLYEAPLIDGQPAHVWIASAVQELQSLPNVTLLRRATVTGWYDHNFLAVVQDHGLAHSPRQTLWKVRASQVILATGAIERPLIFANNDRPGVMLASAMRGYLHHYAVLPARRIVIATNNDTAYATALDLANAGVEVVGIVDMRREPRGAGVDEIARRGIPIYPGHAIVNAHGAPLRRVEISLLDASGSVPVGSRSILGCDALGVSGGWTATLQLYAQSRRKTRLDDKLHTYVPTEATDGCRTVGACAGKMDLAACFAEGYVGGSAAAEDVGAHGSVSWFAPQCAAQGSAECPAPVAVSISASSRCFVDFQNDVTAHDLNLAVREGYRSIEHVKRYTTLGMGTDQGKLGTLNGGAIVARALSTSIATIGTTTARPPYAPVTVGALIGQEVARKTYPLRRGPLDSWHEANGAHFVNTALWRRPQGYCRANETKEKCALREAAAVRKSVGLTDVSTLGKIEVQGPDAAEFLNRIYINSWVSLPIGKSRYGVMLREDGAILDDGVTSRLDHNHFFMTASTGHVEEVFEHMERLLQTAWVGLQVCLTPVTEQWCAAALAGPNARHVLETLVDDVDLSPQAFPHLSVRIGTIANVPARFFRISFSGELAYEIYVQASAGERMWNALLDAGKPYGLTIYGSEAQSILRIEKGFIAVGREADGRATPDDLGMGKMINRTKDSIGRRSLELPAMREPGRRQLVGVVAEDPLLRIPEGSHIVDEDLGAEPQRSLGFITSTAFSPTLGRQIALALVENGRTRTGQTLYATSPTASKTVQVRIVPPTFFDSEGRRLHA